MPLLAHKECDKLIYLDPGIAVFSPLTEVTDLLNHHSIALTLHQTDPDPKQSRTAILDTEVASLNCGVFNLGFVAIANDAEGRPFAQ